MSNQKHPMVSVLELLKEEEEKEVKGKKKGKMEIVDAMPIKRIWHGEDEGMK